MQIYVLTALKQIANFEAIQNQCKSKKNILKLKNFSSSNGSIFLENADYCKFESLRTRLSKSKENFKNTN